MDFARVIYMLYACAHGGALSRAVRSKLYGAYPFFTASLVINLIQYGLLFPYAPSSLQYYKLYSVTAWFVLAFQIGAACEGWAISTRQYYPRIGRVAVWLATYAAVVGVVGAFLVGLPGFDILTLEHIARLQTWHIITVRYSSTVLFCVCGLAWTLNSWLDDGVRPNARRHVTMLTGIFGSQAIGFLIISNYRPWSRIAGLGLVTGIAAFTFLWGIVMESQGEAPLFNERIGDTSVLEQLPALSKRVMQALD